MEAEEGREDADFVGRVVVAVVGLPLPSTIIEVPLPAELNLGCDDKLEDDDVVDADDGFAGGLDALALFSCAGRGGGFAEADAGAAGGLATTGLLATPSVLDVFNSRVGPLGFGAAGEAALSSHTGRTNPRAMAGIRTSD